MSFSFLDDGWDSPHQRPAARDPAATTAVVPRVQLAPLPFVRMVELARGADYSVWIIVFLALVAAMLTHVAHRLGQVHTLLADVLSRRTAP